MRIGIVTDFHVAPGAVADLVDHLPTLAGITCTETALSIVEQNASEAVELQRMGGEGVAVLPPFCAVVVRDVRLRCLEIFMVLGLGSTNRRIEIIPVILYAVDFEVTSGDEVINGCAYTGVCFIIVVDIAVTDHLSGSLVIVLMPSYNIVHQALVSGLETADELVRHGRVSPAAILAGFVL